MLSGPNFSVYEELSAITGLKIIASGGISSLDDIRKLSSMNIYGAVIGKALYDNKIDFKQALKIIEK